MPGNPHKKVVVGQKMQGIPARVYNKLIDQVQGLAGVQTTEPADQTRSANIIKIRNTTDLTLAQFSVLEIEAPMILPSASLPAFKGQVALDGQIPTGTAKFAILLDPLASRKIGRAVIDGVSPARLSADPGVNEFCDSESGNTTTLVPAATGSARILAWELVDDVYWAVVRFPDPSSGGGGGGSSSTYTVTDTLTIGGGGGTGSPTAGTVVGVSPAGTNISGTTLYLKGPPGTGNATPGTFIIQIPVAGASGTTIQSWATAVTFASTGITYAASYPVTFNSTVTFNDSLTFNDTTTYGDDLIINNGVNLYFGASSTHTLAADTNNLALNDGVIALLNPTSADRVLTGMTPKDPTRWEYRILKNTSATYSVKLPHLSGSSTYPFKMPTKSQEYLKPGGKWPAIYDPDDGEWELITVDAPYKKPTTTDTSTAITITGNHGGTPMFIGNASPVALTIGQAGTTGLEQGFMLPIYNSGAGLGTITPGGGSLINGQSSFGIGQYESGFLVSDGTDYKFIKNPPAYGTQSKFWATPASSTGEATMRALTVADLPATAGVLGTTSPGPIPSWHSITKTYSDFSAAATFKTLALATLGANVVVHAVAIHVSTVFSGGGVATCTNELGRTAPSSSTTYYQGVQDVKTNATYFPGSTPILDMGTFAGGAIALTATLRVDGGHTTSQLTQGELVISFLLSAVP